MPNIHNDIISFVQNNLEHKYIHSFCRKHSINCRTAIHNKNDKDYYAVLIKESRYIYRVSKDLLHVMHPNRDYEISTFAEFIKHLNSIALH